MNGEQLHMGNVVLPEPRDHSLLTAPGLRVGGYDDLQGRFETWLATPDGTKVYREVVRRARNLRRLGQEHWSMSAIVEAIRYDWAVKLRHDPTTFRINNDYRSRLARRVMADCPDLGGMFETRGLRA